MLPGQLMTYTINFENEGAGTAYDVFVVDPLADELDTSRMTIYGGGEYIASSRSIIWWAGNLAPKGQPGSTGVVSVKRQGGARARRGDDRQGFVEQSSDEDYVDDFSSNRHHAQN